MAHRLRTWWERIPTSDPLRRQQAGFFQSFLVGWITLATLGLPLNFFRNTGSAASPAPAPESLPPIILVTIWMIILATLMLWLTPIIALVLLRRGRFESAVLMAVWGLLVSHSIATFVLGITDPSVLVVYQIPIVLAGLLGRRRLLVAVSGYSLLFTGLVGILQIQNPPLAGLFSPAAFVVAAGGVAPPVEIGQPLAFFTVVTLLSGLLLDRFNGALRAALSDALQREAELHTIRGSLEATVHARTAELEAALSDAQRRAAEQARLLGEIEQQRGIIRELSVPVLPVSRETLVMPLVGALDSARLLQVQEQALGRIATSGAQCLLLDITGVPVVDQEVAHGLIQVVQAVWLLGAEVILVGIRPEVAQSIIGLGLDLSGIRTHTDLQGALGGAVRRR